MLGMIDQCPSFDLLQNVDGLHHKALRQSGSTEWPEDRIYKTHLELHGTLHVRYPNPTSARSVYSHPSFVRECTVVEVTA